MKCECPHHFTLSAPLKLHSFSSKMTIRRFTTTPKIFGQKSKSNYLVLEVMYVTSNKPLNQDTFLEIGNVNFMTCILLAHLRIFMVLKLHIYGYAPMLTLLPSFVRENPIRGTYCFWICSSENHMFNKIRQYKAWIQPIV